MQPRRTIPKKFFDVILPADHESNENDEAKRKAVPHASACGSAAEGARLEWGYDAALGEALSSRFHNARPDHDPDDPSPQFLQVRQERHGALMGQGGSNNVSHLEPPRVSLALH